MPKINLSDFIETHEIAPGLVVRPALETDISNVTQTIRSSFEVWKTRGLSLRPMYQADDSTRMHLLQKGFVIENDGQRAVATFSLEDGEIKKIDKDKINFREGSDVLSFDKIGSLAADGRFLVFRKAAVIAEYSNKGLGNKMLQLTERAARDQGYSGVALETVAEAEWLFDWYRGLGFEVIGKIRYPGSFLDTLLLIKNLD